MKQFMLVIPGSDIENTIKFEFDKRPVLTKRFYKDVIETAMLDVLRHAEDSTLWVTATLHDGNKTRLLVQANRFYDNTVEIKVHVNVNKVIKHNLIRLIKEW